MHGNSKTVIQCHAFIANQLPVFILWDKPEIDPKIPPTPEIGAFQDIRPRSGLFGMYTRDRAVRDTQSPRLVPPLVAAPPQPPPPEQPPTQLAAATAPLQARRGRRLPPLRVGKRGNQVDQIGL